MLRYWEQEFSQLKPTTRRGNRRYYQQVDILLIRKIRELLYFEGFTILGAKGKLSDRNFFKETTSKQAIEKAQAELPLSGNNHPISATNSSGDLSNFKAQLSNILKILK